ncbi:MAG: hypothetical protein HY675_24860 [Chloroflexi bacterium]|nr:hypothetical protein [Chloroflexota bacterium]
MATSVMPGYAGSLLRVDLTDGSFSEEHPDENTLRKCLGGTGIGAKYLYEEVSPGVEWSHPENRLIIASGPLGGTTAKGSGTISIVTKGPMTNGATSSQANGFMGAFLKLSGFDGIILQGAAREWSYLYVHDGLAELRDARHILGKDTWETEDLIKEELGYAPHSMSVFSIGPAGENLVRFACVVGDRGHVAAHNGPGAVLGAKKLKAIAVARGKRSFPITDKRRLSEASNEMFAMIKTDPEWSMIYQWGMLWFTEGNYASGRSLVKNCTTNLFAIDKERLGKFSGPYIREHFQPKPHPCWACQMHHCHTVKITEGPYAGYVGEEPEAEGLQAWSFLIGNLDCAATIMLSNEVDRLGMDTNEAGWAVALTMECYEKGLLGAADVDGLDMTWGNVDAARTLLHRIARRQGLGDLLADGVMRASQRLGGEIPDIAVYTKSGTPPRSHDHRLRWPELFDTCVSNTGTIENDTFALRPELLDLPVPDYPFSFSPLEVAALMARAKGHFQLIDSLGSCKMTTRLVPRLIERLVGAATGWDFTWQEAMQVGLRTVNLLRAFNIRHGRTRENDAPSFRYSSTPIDGPARGKSIVPFWDQMLDVYYQELGWDRATGKPLPETLRELGLEQAASDLWP